MRVVRAAGQNVSPSDDGRLFDQIFSDGLFTDTTFTNLGGNSVQIGAMYGDLCGRDFTVEQMTLTVTLPEGEGEVTGYIYVEIDTSSDDVITLNSALAPFTPTYEDINTNGAIAQMILAEYTATAVAVTGVTPVFKKVAAGTVRAGSVAAVETAQATQNHSVGEYILLDKQLYIVTAAVSAGETFVEGTNISATSVGSELKALNNGLTRGYSSYMDWPTITCNNGSWQNNTGGNGTGVKPDKSSASGYNLELNVKGRYLIFCIAQFTDGANTSGVRGIRLIVDENPVQEDFIAPPANNTTMQTMGMVNSNGRTRVRMGFYQNSGNALQVQGIHLYAIYMGNW
jgi:hypothetical protein